MIVSVMQFGNQLSLRDRSGQQIGNITFSGEFLGHSSTFVVIRNHGMIVTLDENQNTLGSVVLPQGYRISGITDNGFYAETGGVIEMYDPYCNHVGHF